MKLLILGHKGWIGSMMCRLLDSLNKQYITTEIRSNNPKEFEEFLMYERPTHIMSFIGRTHGIIGNKEYTTIDYLEQDGKLKENIRDNLFSPLVIALYLKSMESTIHTWVQDVFSSLTKITHMVTKIQDLLKMTSPISLDLPYSVVKGYTDEVMGLLDDTVLNLRIRMPIIAEHDSREFYNKNYKV